MSKILYLTSEIEKKLESMSNELLIKTVTLYKNYNYDIEIRDKAIEILKERGINIESIIIKKSQKQIPTNLIILAILIFITLGLSVYLHFKPNYILKGVEFLLFGILLLIGYWGKHKHERRN